MLTVALDFYHFVQPYLFCGKIKQIAYVPLPSRGNEQKTILTHHTAEATCRLRMWWWCDESNPHQNLNYLKQSPRSKEQYKT